MGRRPAWVHKGGEVRSEVRCGSDFCGSGDILRRGVSSGDSYPREEPPLWTQGL